MADPSTNGQKPNGTFAPGNKLGKGNPHIDKVGKLRVAMYAAVTEKAMKSVIRKLIAMAEDGDIKAIGMLLDRTLGKPEVAQTVTVQSAGEPTPRQITQQLVDTIHARRAAMGPQAAEADRREQLRRAGFAANANPSASEILARFRERSEAAEVAD